MKHPTISFYSVSTVPLILEDQEKSYNLIKFTENIQTFQCRLFLGKFQSKPCFVSYKDLTNDVQIDVKFSVII